VKSKPCGQVHFNTCSVTWQRPLFHLRQPIIYEMNFNSLNGNGNQCGKASGQDETEERER